MTLKEVMEKHHISRIQLSRRFGIPTRTIDGWTSNSPAAYRECPSYVVTMIDECLTNSWSKPEQE